MPSVDQVAQPLRSVGVELVVVGCHGNKKTSSLAGNRFRWQGFMPARLDQILTKKANDGGRLHPRLSVWAARRGAAQAGFASLAPAGGFVGQVGYAWAAGDVV